MAFTTSFGPGYAMNPERPTEVARNAVGAVYDSMESSTPLTVLFGGIETTSIASDALGLIARFFTDGVLRIYVEFPGIGRYEMFTYDGTILRVEEARTAALAAANSAAAVEDRVWETVGGVMIPPTTPVYPTKTAGLAAIIAAGGIVGSMVLVEDPDA
ncbi:hypothetical protein [Occultella kanbiaonis]|uniref:hypothetical protein n=1 Tax=Occultella kanbiaonis TaxID=2675754 RepID=UPI0013D65451|nr:hypothetical protein [Occultella kanbiaonis]